MTMQSSSQLRPRPQRIWALGLLFGVEILALAAAYQFYATIECQQTDLFATCRFLRSLAARALVGFAALSLVFWARPRIFARFRDAISGADTTGFARLVHFAGIALLLLPLTVAPGGDVGAIFGNAVWMLAAGSVFAAAGGLAWLVPRREWPGLIWQDGGIIPAVLLLAALLPDAAEWAQTLWNWDLVTRVTFDGVHLFLSLFSDHVISDPANYNIGFPRFTVNIAPQCSGVEGVALVTAFSLLYIFIFRDAVRFPQIWLVLPVAILLSWLLNILRIGLLIVIGETVSPDLAVNGFHSYAGWVFFTILALTIVWLVRAVPWLHRAAAGGPRLSEDPVAAQLVPFVAFMAASLLTHATFSHPEIGYPIRVAAMVLALLPFLAHYRGLVWRPDPVALAVGAIVGAGWILLDRQSSEDGMDLAAALAGLPLWAYIGWIVLRLFGTVLLVPVVEELAFRGYLLARLDGPGPGRRALAIVVSSLAFATLHGRWVEAGLAGLAFAFLALRRGRLADAIIGHMIANLLVSLWALGTDDFTLI